MGDFYTTTQSVAISALFNVDTVTPMVVSVECVRVFGASAFVLL